MIRPLKGLGIAVLPIAAACVFAGQWLSQAVAQDSRFWYRENWPLAAALGVAGVACLALDNLLRRATVYAASKSQIAETAAGYVKHELFYISLRKWGWLLILAGGAVMMFRGKLW